MAARTWSTNSVAPREGLPFWREAVCQAVLNVMAVAPAERFAARISGQGFGALRFAAFSATPHDIVRTKRHADEAGEDAYLISLQCRGASRMTQGDEAFQLDPGEIAIMDGTRPFTVAFPNRVSRVLAVVPRPMLDSRAPWMRCSPLRKLTARSAYFDLARRHLLQLAEAHTLTEGEATLLTDNLCNLLALATARVPEQPRPSPDLQLQAIVAYCRSRLADPGLSPQSVADHFGISVRTLHSRFEGMQVSFGRWLLENRLDACQRALVDPVQDRIQISQIAYRWGFNDLSHFTKAFRARFGVAPREMRLARSED